MTQREAFEAWALRNTSLPSAHEMAWAAWQAALVRTQAEPVAGEWRFDIDESNLYHGDALVASLDNTECTNNSWREACRYGAEIAARMNATPQQAQPDHTENVREMVPAPAVREPLTDEQLRNIARALPYGGDRLIATIWKTAKLFARATEAHHGIGITGGGK